MRNLTLFISLAAGLIIHTNAVAENYVFYNEQALVKISETGEISQFYLGTWDSEKSEEMIDPELKEKITELWHYPDNHSPVQRKVQIIEGYSGCDESLLIKSEYGEEHGLLSYELLPTQKTKSSEAGNRRTREYGKHLLLSALTKHKISPKWQARLLKKVDITPISIRKDHPKFIVISAADEANGKTKSIFIIAQMNDKGVYRISHQSISQGSASDSDGSATTNNLIDHIDLNNDGIDELFVSSFGYESFGIIVMQWDGKQWIEVGSNGGGC